MKLGGNKDEKNNCNSFGCHVIDQPCGLFANTNEHPRPPPSLSASPSEHTVSSVASNSQKESCNCEELEFQIDDYNHPDLPDNFETYPDAFIGAVYSFEKDIKDVDCVILVTLEGIESETSESFLLNFNVDKVYYGDNISGELLVYHPRMRFWVPEVPNDIIRETKEVSYQTVLCPFKENEQYLLFGYSAHESFPYEYSNSALNIIVPTDDLKHSRMSGHWLKDLIDFDIENCKNVDELAQYAINCINAAEA